MTPDERSAATWALLRSYADWMPSVRTSTGQIVRRSALRGEVASDYEDCRSCGGKGIVRRGGKELACRTCSGAGARSVDAYTRREVEREQAIEEISYERLIRFRRVRCDVCGGSGLQSASSTKDPGLRDVLELDGEHRHWWRAAERERCSPCRGSGSIDIVDERQTDASLRRLASDEAARAGVAVSADWLDSALERRRMQWARGSYAELAQVLRRLELRVPRLHAALVRHVVFEPGEYVVSPELRERIEIAVVWIASELPADIRVSADVKIAHTRKHVVWRHRSAAAQHERGKRNGHIAGEVLDAGRAPDEVAPAAGVSPRRVRQIVASAWVQGAEPDAVATFAL